MSPLFILGQAGLMALVVYWYDFICFAIVGVAFLGAFWVLIRKEGPGRLPDGTAYESLLLTRPDSDVYTRVTRESHVSSTQPWASCWRGVHPAWLLVLRLVYCVVLAVFLYLDIVEWGATIFVYYTEWTFTLVTIYFGLGTLISAYGCWVYSRRGPSYDGAGVPSARRDLEEGNPAITATAFRGEGIEGTVKLQSHYDREESFKNAGFWGYLFQVIYQTCAGAVILTDIVFWCIIVPFMSTSHLSLNYLTACMHSLNFVFLLLDTCLNSLPFPWFRLSYFILWSCIYVVFQWVIHACGFSWWPYPFLELSTPWAILWYACLAVVHVPCYGLYSLIIKAKIKIFSRLFPNAFIGPY